jgi:predicted nuclease with TOPRIM domain
VNNTLFIFNSVTNNTEDNVEALHKTISRLENENYLLKNDADNLKQETNEFEKKEQEFVENCVKELGKFFFV